MKKLWLVSRKVDISSLINLYEADGYDDGINSAIQVCHLIDDQNKKISELKKELPNTYQSPTMAP